MWTQLGPRKRKTSDVTMPTGVNLGTNTIRGSAEVKLSRDVLGGRIWGSPRPTSYMYASSLHNDPTDLLFVMHSPKSCPLLHGSSMQAKSISVV